MTKLTKVTMNLTEKDVLNTEHLREKFHSRSNAEAVSAALSISSSLADIIQKGDEIYIRNKSGETEKLVITGLNV